MIITWHTYAIILPLIFFAGLVDAIAGGGGLISVPAYLAAGLPPHYALGNNKFSSSIGTLFTVMTYHKKNMIDLRIALVSALFALAGSFTGARTVLMIDPNFLQYILVVLIPAVTAFVLIRKDIGIDNHSMHVKKSKAFALSSIAAFIIGFYDGFFGPGTGAFLILFYTVALRYDFVTANANTKVVNLASNIAAIVTFIINGKVIYQIGIPAAVCGVAGNLLGANIVIKKGRQIVRPVFILVLMTLFIKIVYDILK